MMGDNSFEKNFCLCPPGFNGDRCENNHDASNEILTTLQYSTWQENEITEDPTLDEPFKWIPENDTDSLESFENITEFLHITELQSSKLPEVVDEVVNATHSPLVLLTYFVYQIQLVNSVSL